MPDKLSYKKLTFNNGFTAILYPITSVASAYMTLYVRNGAIYETPEINGISHFAEHYIYQGTINFPKPHILDF